MTLSPGSKLGPYEILYAIGSGGMGEVWKARDTRLGRIVAIKKVKEQHSERFKQEARSIAAMNHPNICQIFDIGDDYLVLEYVEGKPLSSPLPEQEAVKLAIQIATALEAAHKKGIIHRDLKPSNIMVSDEGTVKLLDFGLAKLYEQDQSTSNLPTADFPATQAGAILGTVAYMSPEQAQGQPADARSDIFSFGLVLYEMLSGRRAFSGSSASETIAALLRDEAAPLKTSPALEKIVKRCLEKIPDERYQTMAELKAALEKAVKPKVTVSSEEPQPSIAVLPFVNMSGDKEQEYFSDGLAEEIINAFTHISGLRVAGRTSSFFFRGKDIEFSEIGKKLSVRHILEGSVRKSGSRIRVTAQLIDVSDGFHLWSERYDREMTDVFAIQDEISQAIAEKLRVRLAGDRVLKRRLNTKNVEAYQLFLRGRHCMYRMMEDSLSKGKEYLEQAITLDPSYPLAYAGIAEYYFWNGWWGYMDSKEALSRTKSAAMEALSHDGELAEAYSMLGAALGIGDFDWIGAERMFRRAVDLNPASPMIHYHYGFHYFRPTGRLDEAVSQLQRAVEMDPLSATYNINLGYLYYERGQCDLAIEQHLRGIDLDPAYFAPHWLLAIVYAYLGRLEEAIAETQKAYELSEHNPILFGYLGLLYGRAGLRNEAQAILKELITQSSTVYVPFFSIAAVYRGLGELDQGLEWIERAVEERDMTVVCSLKLEPAYNSLHSHPRYKGLLRKMNLEA
jgi:serine/threonine protein kinase/tetratricopeptide (TPR) repeat protein